MTREQAQVLLADIFRDVLRDDALTIDEATRLADLPGLDSLAGIDLLAAAEIRFGIEIRCAEAERIATCGELIDLILAKAPRVLVH